MTPELEKYYENRWEMMALKGWKDLMEDAQARYDALNQIHTAKTFEEFNYRKGQVEVLNWLLTLKSVSEQAYEELKSEDTV